MISRSLRLVPLILLLRLSASGQFMTDSIEFDGAAERSFVAAMRMFIAGSYDSASVMFMEHLRGHPRSHRTTGAFIMGGKALHEARKYRESIRLLKDLLDLYPGSTYTDDAQYTLALNYLALNRPDDALEDLFLVRSGTSDTALYRRTERLLDKMFAERLSVERVEEARDRAPDIALRVLASIRIAERIQRGGDIRRALEVLQFTETLPADIRYVTEANDLRARLQQGRTLKVGAVLPLMLTSTRPGVRDLGVEFLEGMRIAVDDFNVRSISKVVLETKDTERDAAVAAKTVSELCSDANIVAILGPVLSTEALAAAGIAQTMGVPMLTPTATSNGIAAIGENVFQANPDYDVRGRAMAAYAFNELGARTFAVLAPTDAVGKLMADGFIAEVKERGGDLVDVQWYYAGSMDLRSQLEAMRRVALSRKIVPYVDFSVPIKHQVLLEMAMAGADQRVIDSLVEVGGTRSLDSLLGSGAKAFADSIGLRLSYTEVDFDSLGITVDSIDALFVPIADSDEIAVVSSQLQLYNFQCAVLGTGDWYELSELDRNRRYTLGTYFSVDIWPNPRDSLYRYVAAEYKRRTARNLTENVLMGHDAASLLLSVISKGATTRSEVAAGLSAVRDFVGLRSNVSFTPNRVNGYLCVLRYSETGVIKVGEVDLTHPQVTLLPAVETQP